MKKNNVVYFFVDSVTWDCIGTNRAQISPTPFLDSLKEESLVSSNLYAHGPYTDAATRSLFTGRNCLDDFGYFFKLNTSPTNHYKVFKECGYETYDFNYPYYIIGPSIKSYIDHPVYIASFVFNSEWGGIYKYFSDIYKQRDLTDEEYVLVKSRMDLMFMTWLSFLNDIITVPECISMHEKAIPIDVAEKMYNNLNNEYKEFKKDSSKYLINLLKLGQNHQLNKIDQTGIESYINNEFLDYISKRHKNFFKKVTLNNIRANLIKNMPSPKRVFRAIKSYLKNKDKSEFLFLENYLISLFPIQTMKRRWKMQGWQDSHSAYSMYHHAMNILNTRNSDTPFFFFLCAQEPHNNISFFSFDTDDPQIIDKEFKILNDYVDALGTNFKGNLMYLLSLRYIDYQIEEFCNHLKKLNLWDSTTIMYIADHGSSYTFSPLHNTRVNNFYDECYHVPMIIRSPGFPKTNISSFHSSKDVLPTLLDVLKLPQSLDFKGSSMLQNAGSSAVLTEYMGPGCPEMLHRRIWFSARDNKFVIAYKVGIYENFDDGELCEVYNLEKDPHTFYNISDKINRNDIKYLLDLIHSRYQEIKRDTIYFINNLENPLSKN